MHAWGPPLSAFLIQIGWVRGTIDARNDANSVRGRVAMALFIPATIALMYLTNLLRSPAILIGVPVVLTFAWLYALAVTPVEAVRRLTRAAPMYRTRIDVRP